MFRLENNEKVTFRTKREAGWAAFFEELGVKYEYSENKDFDTAFYLPDMRIHVEILDENDQISVNTMGEWLKGFVGIDRGSIDRPLDDSAVLIDSDPWVKQESKPLGTLFHGDEEPRLTTVNDRMTGVFMNIGNKHTYVVARCSKIDHFGGAMISAVDALPLITEDDKKNWNKAIDAAKERKIIDLDEIVEEPSPVNNEPFLQVEEDEPVFTPVNNLQAYAQQAAKESRPIKIPKVVEEDIVELPSDISLDPKHYGPFGPVGNQKPIREPEEVEKTLSKDELIKTYVEMFLKPGDEFTNIFKVDDLANYCGQIIGIVPSEDELKQELFNQGFPLRKVTDGTAVGLDSSAPIYFVRLPLSYKADPKNFCNERKANNIKKALCN